MQTTAVFCTHKNHFAILSRRQQAFSTATKQILRFQAVASRIAAINPNAEAFRHRNRGACISVWQVLLNQPEIGKQAIVNTFGKAVLLVNKPLQILIIRHIGQFH